MPASTVITQRILTRNRKRSTGPRYLWEKLLDSLCIPSNFPFVIMRNTAVTDGAFFSIAIENRRWSLQEKYDRHYGLSELSDCVALGVMRRRHPRTSFPAWCRAGPHISHRRFRTVRLKVQVCLKMWMLLVYSNIIIGGLWLGAPCPPSTVFFNLRSWGTRRSFVLCQTEMEQNWSCAFTRRLTTWRILPSKKACRSRAMSRMSRGGLRECQAFKKSSQEQGICVSTRTAWWYYALSAYISTTDARLQSTGTGFRNAAFVPPVSSNGLHSKEPSCAKMQCLWSFWLFRYRLRAYLCFHREHQWER